MMRDEVIFTSKIYLVKIKLGTDFKDEDILWAIGHQGSDNIDLEDLNSIVGLNKKSVRTPILSDKRGTWKAIKNSADCKAFGYVGEPTLLLEEVQTFKKILEFAYAHGIFADPRGESILATKNEELMTAVKRPRVSQTLEEASKEMLAGSETDGQPMSKAVKRMMAQSAAMMNVPGVDNLSAAVKQLTNSGEFSPNSVIGSGTFPAPVPRFKEPN